MGTVLEWPRRHARPRSSSSKKSSAVISPPENSFSLPIVDQSGLTLPRRIRLTVTRETLIAAATSSSDKPRDSIKAERCDISELYVERTPEVKGKCTYGVVPLNHGGVHDAYMAGKAQKKVVPRFKEKLGTTFIREWREFRGLTQGQVGERVGVYLSERGLGDGYSHASIGRIENGKMAYTQPVLEAIADALNTDPASLLMRNPAQEDAIWSLWEQAQPAQRRQIIRVIKGLLDSEVA